MQLGNEWDDLLREEFQKEYYLKLRTRLKEEYQQHTVYPSMENIFNALKFTPYKKVKVVILGQDPYHGPGQAHGLAFSVQRGVQPPPSLQNIFQELSYDVGFEYPGHGCLTDWALDGVLLLNSTLTVRAGSANSHKDLGWTIFTDRVIELLNARPEPMVFLLWGSYAKAKMTIVTNPAHLVLTAAHPSPFSASNGFFGCHHFSKANTFLRQFGKEMNWLLHA